MSAVRFAVPALLVYAAPALAASTPGGADSDVGSAVRVFASLAVVIALIFAASWLLKRLQRGSLGGSAHLRCIESIAVGMKERVVLVQAGERQLLLGVAPGNVCTLHVFDEPLAVADATQRAPSLAFRNVLAQFRGASK